MGGLGATPWQLCGEQSQLWPLHSHRPSAQRVMQGTLLGSSLQQLMGDGLLIFLPKNISANPSTSPTNSRVHCSLFAVLFILHSLSKRSFGSCALPHLCTVISPESCHCAVLVCTCSCSPCSSARFPCST